jgi:hypothetical protein
MEYQDLIWHFSSRSSGSRNKMTLQVFSSDEDYFRNVTAAQSAAPRVSLPFESESPQSKSGRISTLTLFQAQTLGSALFKSLPDEATSPLLNFYGGPNRALRLKISSDLPACDDLPWECLCTAQGDFFALRPEVRIVRSIPVLVKSPPATVIRPVRVLLVITNPKDERLLDSFRELPAVFEALKFPDYRYEVVSEPTFEAFLREARSFEPQIVHYIGHAGINGGEGNLILHDYSNGTRWVCPSDLASTLPLSVRLICLSTCFTTENYNLLGLPRFAHAAGQLRLPTFVTNQRTVDETTVRIYWSKFYEELLASGGNVNEACHVAALNVSAGTDPASWTSFSTVVRDGSGEVMKIVDQGAVPAAQLGNEIRAQFAARLANNMAQSVRMLGDNVSSDLSTNLKLEVARVTKLYEGNES